MWHQHLVCGSLRAESYRIPNHNILSSSLGPRNHLFRSWCFVATLQQPRRSKAWYRRQGSLHFVVDALFIARLNVLGTDLRI